MKLLFGLALIAVSASACAASSSDSATTNAEPTHTEIVSTPTGALPGLDFWNSTYDQVGYMVDGISTDLPDGIGPEVEWKATLLEDGRRGLQVDTGCNEITGFDFVGQDLSSIQASIDTTLKGCGAAATAFEGSVATLLTGPSVIESLTTGWQLTTMDGSIAFTLEP